MSSLIQNCWRKIGIGVLFLKCQFCEKVLVWGLFSKFPLFWGVFQRFIENDQENVTSSPVRNVQHDDSDDHTFHEYRS